MLIRLRLPRSVGASLALLLLLASNAAADTVRVLVDRALIWSRPSGVSVVLTQVSRGTELTLLAQVGDWYEVVLPGARGRVGAPTGFIRTSQAVVWILEPNGPMQASRRADSRRRPRTPSFVSLDAGYRLGGGDDLVRTASAFADTYAEAGHTTTNYGNGSGPQLDVTVGGYISPKFGIAAGLSFYPRLQDGHIDAEVPHPFYFNQLRPASLDSSEAKGNELGVHVSVLVAVWDTPKQRLSVFGGPSFFRLTQKAPTTLTIAEEYPYDTAAIDGVKTTTEHASAVGFHVGGDFTRFITARTGLGVAVRYSHGSVDATIAPQAGSGNAAATPGSTTAGTAGSAVVSGGIRFRF